jgi:hypothetical protein
MKINSARAFVCAMSVVSSLVAAQETTSRVIPFTLSTWLPPGTIRPQGPPGMSLLWVDANGLVLGTVALLDYGSTGGGVLLDSNGWFWLVDTNTASIEPVSLVGRFYTNASCMGTAHISAPPVDSSVRPRWAIGVLGVSGYFARGDQQQIEGITPASYFDGAICSFWTGGRITAIRFDEMSSVPPLTFNPVGPVHVEQR